MDDFDFKRFKMERILYMSLFVILVGCIAFGVISILVPYG